MAHLERVIILIDMDCFYCQVEEKLDSNLEGKPIAVVQYNQWRGGGIIAVNYPARDRGVTRHMRGKEAKEKCPDIILARVPQIRGKADLSKYRDAGKKVADVLQTFTDLLERASVDEAYLDVTNLVLNKMKDGIDQISIDKLKNTFVVGCETHDFLHNLSNSIEFTENNLKLCLGGMIAEKIRAEVFEQTGYKCSAGIAHNKILAKLVCGLNKPNKQTILPHDAVPTFFQTLPIKKVKTLGGKFGTTLSEELSISTMGELANFTEKQLVEKFGRKNGSWLYNISRGVDFDPVVTRLITKSIGCCKKFPGRTALVTHKAVQHWIGELAIEIAERLEKDFEENKRRAKQMVINFAQEVNKKEFSNSRTHPLNSYERAQIAKDALEVVKKNCQKPDGSYSVIFLGISVSNFQEDKKIKDIASYFKKSVDLKETQPSISEEEEKQIMTVDEESVEDEEIENVGNQSIYSASTDELEEDPKSYIYFEDIYPEFVSSQPLETEKTEKFVHKGDPSITLDLQESQLDKRKASNSFFMKYFESIAEHMKSPEMIPPREVEAEPERIIKDITDVETNNSDCNKSYEDSDTKVVNIEKLVRRKSNEASSSGIKRKASETNILNYFPKPEKPNENFCEECKKNIPLEELFDHSDYHVAKNLQNELNKSEKVNINKVKPKNKKNANLSISDFFKRA